MDIVFIVVMVLIESIPVYTKTVNLDLVLRQQPQVLYATQTSGALNGSVELSTANRSQKYTLESLLETPAIIHSDIIDIRYVSNESSINNPVVFQNWNGHLVLIAPQTQLLIKENKKFTDPATSLTTYDVKQ